MYYSQRIFNFVIDTDFFICDTSLLILHFILLDCMRRSRQTPVKWVVVVVGFSIIFFLLGLKLGSVFQSVPVHPISRLSDVTVTKATTTQIPIQTQRSLDSDLRVEKTGNSSVCAIEQTQRYVEYFRFSQEGKHLQEEHGQLRIAAFSRLWVPPLHGTGGMQYHALHLYSQLASRGHEVHVFVTGPPDVSRQKTLRFRVNSKTLELEELPAGSVKAMLTVHQVASDKNGEYSVGWYENCLTKFGEVNRTVGGFHVSHSESWAAVPNLFQLGLQMVVTWHGSMLDWFRNEVNLIVHNFRMKSKMTGAHTAKRMNDLGSSVAYEAYMLLAVPHHVVISDSAADNLADINLIDEAKIHLIYNGVNPSSFQPATNKNDARRVFIQEHAHGLEMSPDTFLVGCGGRLESIKGHHQLSEAMKLVLKTHPNIVLLVSGDGGERYRYDHLKQTYPSQVFLLGMLKQNVLAKFYQVLDVFVDPFYQHHGLNTVMLEAVLTGIPIIVTKLASSQTTAPCTEFGRTFRLGDTKELANQILHYHQNPQERIEVGKSVRERALHLFSSSIMAGSYETLFYKVYLNPMPLPKLTGKVVCRHTYPAMCYREPV